jgi:hypothetical protein
MTTGAWSLVPKSASTAQLSARSMIARRREYVVETPADVALAHIPPRRPPGEQPRVVGIERSSDVHQVPAEQILEESALFGPLPDQPGLPLARMHVHLGAGDVDVRRRGRDRALRAAARGPTPRACA